MLYVFLLPKSHLFNDWQCFLGVSNCTIVVVTFNMILVNGKGLKTIKTASVVHSRTTCVLLFNSSLLLFTY